MKKKIPVAAMALLITCSATFAQEATPVPAVIVNGLTARFTNVSNAAWKTTSNFYKATFTVDGQPMEAYYAFDGSLMAVVRKIAVEQLPMILLSGMKDLREFKEKEPSFLVSDLFEILRDGNTEYYITLKNDKEIRTYKSDNDYWSLYQHATQGTK